MDKPTIEATTRSAHWTMLRDLWVLQVKLVVDGLRDVILVPASLIAGMASLATSHDGQPGPHFYRLLSLGKQSELWINLFGALKNSPKAIDHPEELAAGDIDDLVSKFESYVVDEYKRGGVTKQAKDHFDKVLNTVRRKNKDD